MAYPNKHDLGDLVKVVGTFTGPDDDDAPVDPDMVKLSFRDPSDNVTTWIYGSDDEIVKDSTGVYYALIDADEAGDWYYRWWSTGAGQAAEEKQFTVRTALAVEIEE
jgi:hypothetical protein